MSHRSKKFHALTGCVGWKPVRMQSRLFINLIKKVRCLALKIRIKFLDSGYVVKKQGGVGFETLSWIGLSMWVSWFPSIRLVLAYLTCFSKILLILGQSWESENPFCWLFPQVNLDSSKLCCCNHNLSIKVPKQWLEVPLNTDMVEAGESLRPQTVLYQIGANKKTSMWTGGTRIQRRIPPLHLILIMNLSSMES